MTEKNQGQEIFRDATNDLDLDRDLDTALAKYAAIEPRQGLEERVLASMRAAQRREDRSWWRWPVVVAAAIVVVVAVLAWRSGKPPHPAIASHPAIQRQIPSTATTQPANREAGALRPPAHGSIRVHSSQHVAAAAANPKLDVFPSPQPLSDQEKILVSYVAQFHKQAVLIARVANEELERDRMEMMGEPQNNAGTAKHAGQETTNQ